MSKHTPGPWIISDGDEWTHDVVTHHGELPDGSPNAWNIATINSRRDECDANLALIAAAPDLLEALEKIMSLVDASGSTPHPSVAKVIGAGRAAIAKVKGEQK